MQYFLSFNCIPSNLMTFYKNSLLYLLKTNDRFSYMNNSIEFVNHVKIKHLRFIVNKIIFCNSHVHNDFEIAMLLKGKGITTVETTHYKMLPGDIIFINSGEKHSYSALSEENFISKEDFVSNTPVFLIIQISNHFLMQYFPDIRNTLFESCDAKKYIPEEYRKMQFVIY